MIGKKEWFTTRRYFGVGLRPVAWQGWVYVLVFIAGLLLLIHAPDFWVLDSRTRGPAAFGWFVLFLADTVWIWIALRGK
ncbi:MAG: hypothetical protein JXQ83_02515 [Candidatus Glassbacteria bacterium]|nr:hypothetical protein [Candidatus Glassbacteria bacterium]